MAAGDPGDRINKQDIFDLMYPVGSIYININNTNPSTFFGGTWIQIKDSFLLSAGNTYTGGNTGGAASASYTPAGTVNTHTLTTAEIPSHAHGLNNHVHSLNSHTHGLNGHTHSLNDHTHSIPNHTHTYWYGVLSFKNGASSGANYAANTVSGPSGAAGSVSTSGWSGTTGKSSGNTGGNSGNTTAATGNTGAASGNTANAGSGGGHNHGFTGTTATINTLPPYLVVYVWKRTE